MRGYIVSILLLVLLVPLAFAAQSTTYNGKTYYVVSGDNPNENTGNKVCAQAGLSCVGYTETSNAVCKKIHPTAATSSSWSGDKSGVYCNGAPQSGVCATKQNTCHTCPQCTNTVDCGTPIGGLYKEMYVECAASSSCNVYASATNTQQFLNEIPSINAQLRRCPQSLPKGTGLVVSNGNIVVDISMNSGATESLGVTVSGGRITGIARGSSKCQQRVTITENDLNTVLGSSNRVAAATFMFGAKRFRISGCTFIRRVLTAVTNPVARFVARRAAPSPPPPPPPPNCGQVGEQCNNRGCFSGMCGAPRENLNGQWGYWNYQCIDQAQYTANCIGRGNSPPSWRCLTGPCR